jgi:hypothetical protein
MMAVKTVQVALRDSEQAQWLRDLLIRDGLHQVHLMEQPDMTIAGVIITDIDHLEGSGVLAEGRERLVVVTSRANSDLYKVWSAGIRHVVFQGDAPQTVRVAVLATELTLAAPEL